MQTLNITTEQYLVALMIFIVAFIVIQTPSVYMLKKFRPSRWMALMMLCWGAMTMLLASVQKFGSLVAVRFLLGAFESGLFPGQIYLLTFWYKPEERAVRIALIVACSSLGGAFGGAIAYGIGRVNGAGGLEGWRWLFLIEGAPSCIAATLCALFFPDYPETVSWLSDEERGLATERIKGVASVGSDKITWKETKATLMDWRLYMHYVAYISISVPFSSNSLFTPTIVAGLGFKGLNAQFFTVPPYAIAFVVTVAVAWFADRNEARSIATACSMIVAGVSFIVQGTCIMHQLAPPRGSLRINECYRNRSTTARRIQGAIWFPGVRPFVLILVHPSLLELADGKFEEHRGRDAGRAAECRVRPVRTDYRSVESYTNILIAGDVQVLIRVTGVYIYKDSEAPGFPTGHFTNAGFLIGGAILIASLRFVYVYRNKRLGPGERQWRL